MKRKLAVAQGTVMRLLQAAGRAGRARDYAQAVELAERAQRLDPAEVTKPVFNTAVGRWRNYQKYLEPHLPVLEPFVKELGYE